MASSSNNTNGLTPNVAAALSYPLGFISGLFFFMTSKDKFVRFHALQSTITCVGFIVLNLALNMVGLYFLTGILNLAIFLLFVFLVVKAYQGEEYKLPVVGDIALKNV